MLNQKFAVYLGQESQDRFIGFLSDNGLFLIVEVEGIAVEDGRRALALLKENLSGHPFPNLAAFEEGVIDSCKKANIPNSFSLAACLVNQAVLYLKTTGKGMIYLARRNDFAKIIDGDQSASGYISGEERFILTVPRFIDIIGGEKRVSEIFRTKVPSEVVDELTPQIKAKDDAGAIALFLNFQKEETTEEEKDVRRTPVFLDTIRTKLAGKKMTSIFVFFIAVLLIWSVGFGVQRRSNSEIQKKIKKTSEIVELKLHQAEEVAFLNLPRSQIFISEAKQEVSKLKKEIGERNVSEVTELEELIREKENMISRKEEKKYEEFYDLTLDSKGAKGDRAYLDSDRMAILDRAKSAVYLLSLKNKSLTRESFAQAKSARLVGLYGDDVFLLVDGEGIYKGTSGKMKQVIKQDSDWGQITDMGIYNGNLYLLDTGKDEIYKYVVTESGYSEKSSYFKTGQSEELKGANSISIDSSVYVGFSDSVRKFTAGLHDDFKTDFPQEDPSLSKVFTGQQLEKVYVWDKEHGIVYVLSKQGSYERQIESDVLKEGGDFVVSGSSGFILRKEKIFKIDLD